MPKEHGYPLDHIGLAVNDLDSGLEHINDLMGIEPVVHPADSSNPYQNATFKISEDSFFEIIAPNKLQRGFNPFKSLLKSFSEPTLFYWIVAVNDFHGFRQSARQYGIKMQNVVEINDVDTSLYSAHIRGMMGPGFFGLRPSIIEWRSEVVELSGPVECSLENFSLYYPKPEVLNKLFRYLGIAITVQAGESKLSLELQTPKGLVKLENEAYRLTPFGMARAVAKEFFKI